MSALFTRRPVFDRKLNVLAYELPYHTDLGVKDDVVFQQFDIWARGGPSSTISVMETFADIGLENLICGKSACVRFDLRLLEEKTYTRFPREHLWVQVSGLDPANRYLAACQVLKSEQYRLILDDFRYAPDRHTFLQMADLVRLDMQRVHGDAGTVAACLAANVPMLAYNVQTVEDYQWALASSFSYFQGDFFSRPVVLVERKIDPLRGNYVQLLALVSEPDIDFSRVADVIRRDVALSYKLLRLVNSPYFGLRSEIKNIQHALAVLGVKEVRKWVSLLSVMSVCQQKTYELMRMSMIRARFMETFGARINLGYSSEDLFLVGMFSLLDVILERSMSDLLEQIPLPRAISETLLEGAGKAAEPLRMAVRYEACDWKAVLDAGATYGLDDEALSKLYAEALVWCDSLFN